MSAKLLLVIFASSVLDLLGIAVIFPYLALVTDPQALANVTARLPQFARELSAGTLLLLMSVLLLLAYFVKSACQVLLMRYQSRQLAGLTTRLTDDTVEHMLNVRYGLFLALAGTEIGATVYASPIHFTLAYRAMLQIASELTFMMALFVAFLVVKPLPTLVAFGVLGAVGIFLYLLVIRNTAKLGKRQSEAENTRYRLIFSMINAFREIKIMGLARLFETFNREVSHELEGVAWRYNFNHAYRDQPNAFAEYNGAEVVRVPLLSRGTGSLRLMLNYLSFVLGACSFGPWRLRGNPPVSVDEGLRRAAEGFFQ